MRQLLGDEYEEFVHTYRIPPETGLRVNTLKVSPCRFRRMAPCELKPVPWCESGFVVEGEAQPGKHPYHAAGLYYLQDASAMAVAELLAPRPGERVLDLAAAPGGKATHIAALMENAGLLVANEIHPARVQALVDNLERWGARNGVITNESPDRLAAYLEGFFDKVLVDAPCSGEGMFRKSEAARIAWTPELVRGCAVRQLAILDAAARMVRPGGVLAYSTCTFGPEENEGVVVDFLGQHPDFELVEPPALPGCTPGRPDWLDDARRRPDLRRAVRLWPHLGPGDGHFVALLVRRGREQATGPWSEPRQPGEVPGRARQLYEAFCQEHLGGLPAEERLSLVGSRLYQVPAGLPDLRGLRVVRPGWHLGTIRRGRFEPGHALALGLTLRDARQVVNLPADGDDVLRYLRGEPLEAPGDAGWVLVALDGYPLGWGKRVGRVVKNHYPRGLRWV